MQFLQVITGQEELCKYAHTVDLTFSDLENQIPIMIDMSCPLLTVRWKMSSVSYIMKIHHRV